MDAVLLDTDVFSYLTKGDTRAELYSDHIRGKTIALSFITVGELFFWTVRRKWSATRIANLEQRIKAAVIVPYDMELCREFVASKPAAWKLLWPLTTFGLQLVPSVIRFLW